jgi:hypothetical protein
MLADPRDERFELGRPRARGWLLGRIGMNVGRKREQQKNGANEPTADTSHGDPAHGAPPLKLGNTTPRRR